MGQRLPAVRLWQTRVGRRLSAGLAHLGIDVAATVRYAAAPAAATDRPASTAPDAFALSTWAAGDPDRPDGGPTDLGAEDVLVGATLEGDLVGYCVLSTRAGGGVDAEWEDDAVALWDLYVEPAYRGRGLGSALLRRARRARPVERGDGVAALVAADNRPSRRAFRAAGFRPTDRLISVGWGERRYHRRRGLGTRQG